MIDCLIVAMGVLIQLSVGVRFPNGTALTLDGS